MNNLELQKCILGPVYTNCYFLKNKVTGEMIIIDPADCPEKIEQKVMQMDGKPVAILLTHGHFDHITAVEAVKEKYHIPVYACRQEEEMLREPVMNMTCHYEKSCSIVPDVFLDDLDVFRTAGFSIQIIHTPGHTKGSCCYYLKDEGVLFSGDTLFCGSVGRTDFPGGSASDIVRSLHKLLDSLPEETEVIPDMMYLLLLVMKRGIIHLYKIDILFLDREFEHDVYELIKAFYPEAEIHTLYDEAEAGEYDLRFRVERENETYKISYDRRENVTAGFTERKGVASADVIGEDKLTVKDPHALRKENKDALKYALYQLLVKLTGRTLPWGNLTGIRPAKLAMGMIESGMKNTEAAREMREKYLVSPEKTALAVTIANREREILKDIDYENGYSLYIGIPFCPSICLYCSFSSYPLKVWEKRTDEYVEALCKEIRETAFLMQGRKLDTIYIGGGTPTTLLPHQLRKLLDTLGEAFGYEGLAEFTIEAGRPDSITREKLQAIREYPVTRISVNPQTMNQETLDLIGRRHTVEQTREAFYLARELGYDNINMDLIVGLPGEDISMVERTLEQIQELAPDSMTVHSLAVKRAARLNIFKEKYQEMSFENNQEIMDLTMKTAYEMGMGPYYLYRQKNMKGNFENVGYAKVDKAGIYNILIMEEKQPIIALGAGGSSKLVFDHGNRIERVENVKDVSNYISRIDEMIQRKQTAISTWL